MKLLSFVDEYYSSFRQTQDIEYWAKQHRSGYSEMEYMYVSLDSYKRYIHIGGVFSLENTPQTSKEKEISIVVCRPEGFIAACNELHSFADIKKIAYDFQKWVKIFSSPVVEVWEYSYEHLVQPLRFGVSYEEKKLLLSFARFSLESALQEKNSFQKTIKHFQEQGYDLSRFFQKIDVDVAFWIGGELRGSRIVEGYSCLEAIYHATLLAAEDVRFRPLDMQEVPGTRIELTLFSDLRISLSEVELQKNEMYPEKGYYMNVNGEKGWYVPAVFNCTSFINLDLFLKSLLSEKINKNKQRSQITRKSVYVFEVFDCIEAIDKKNVMNLHGPVLEVNEDTQEKNFSVEEYEMYAKNALDFLTKIQETDGSYPGVISPFTSKRNNIDWIRSCLLVWSIALSLQTFPSLKQENLYKKCLLEGFSFLKKYVYNHRTMSAYVRCLSLIYYHKIALLLGDEVEAQRSHSVVMSLIDSLEYEPILYVQIGIHILEHKHSTESERKKACMLAKEVLEDFQEKKSKNEPISTASYADLCSAVRLMEEFLEDKELLAVHGEIIEWYKKQQNEDGSFSSATASHYRYTRGTSKILEALGKEKSLFKDKEFSRGIAWLHSMQYKKEGVYFVLEPLQQIVVGGFRHDYQNASLWIDSSAHYLIALCYRFSSYKKI